MIYVLQRLGPMEILLIALVVLLIFGAKKLPQLGKGVGEGILEFKKAFKAVKEEPNEEKSA